MITRIEVDGFKSLRGFAVDLEPFTAFIGPNGAGKSNILEALALLSRLASEPIVDAFRHGRGRASDQFSRHGGEVAGEIRFAAELLLFGMYSPGAGWRPFPHNRFRYELVIERVVRSSGTEHLLARHEELRCLRLDEDAWIDAHPEFAAFVTHSDDGPRLVATPDRATQFSEQGDQYIRVDPTRTVLALHELRSDADFVFASANLRACQWLRLDLAHLAGPSDRVDTGALRPDGSNLPTILADLPAPLLGDIRADLVALVPGLSSFAVVREDDTFRVDFELSGGERLPARLISDGTLRLLALLTALRLDPRPYLVGIEEPENGIYPGRLRALIELLRHETQRRLHEEPGVVAGLDEQLKPQPDELWAEQIVGARRSENLLPTQILLTTHSPVILAALRNHPQHLRFVDTVHRDGRRVTRARAVGQPTPETRHLVVSPREIDQLLDAATSEALE